MNVLSQLEVGETGILDHLELPEEVQEHLMHMGFVAEAHVVALRRAPAGDPTVYGIDGMEIALRHETARSILVRKPGETRKISEVRKAGKTHKHDGKNHRTAGRQ